MLTAGLNAQQWTPTQADVGDVLHVGGVAAWPVTSLQTPLKQTALENCCPSLSATAQNATPFDFSRLSLLLMRVLYVEDNADVRELIVMLLEDEGLTVVNCADANAAEVEFAKQHFDVLITDVSLPDVPGTELAARLQRGRSDLWVVFCSGYPMHHGLHAFGPRARALRKPFEAEELHALLAEIRALSVPGVD
jgi:two-component system, cell cycle response regulator CpdR